MPLQPKPNSLGLADNLFILLLDSRGFSDNLEGKFESQFEGFAHRATHLRGDYTLVEEFEFAGVEVLPARRRVDRLFLEVCAQDRGEFAASGLLVQQFEQFG